MIYSVMDDSVCWYGILRCGVVDWLVGGGYWCIDLHPCCMRVSLWRYIPLSTDWKKKMKKKKR